MPPEPTHAARLARARTSLDGLSVGDAFGQRFFASPMRTEALLRQRLLDDPVPWRWTDDTAMALELFATLEAKQAVDPHALAAGFLGRYQREPWRGYGGGAHRLFDTIAGGTDWEVAAGSLFGGAGSFGNGGAMRVAPVGAYFADDLDRVVEAAIKSALVTHAHPEGQAGAVAVAVAAAVAWRTREAEPLDAARSIYQEVLARTPPGETLDGIERARNTKPTARVETAVHRLGNGVQISSQDTVPLCIWCITREPRDYEAAMWTTVSALGDRDTTCAIVGGVVALSAAPTTGIPATWLASREPLTGMSLERMSRLRRPKRKRDAALE